MKVNKRLFRKAREKRIAEDKAIRRFATFVGAANGVEWYVVRAPLCFGWYLMYQDCRGLLVVKRKFLQLIQMIEWVSSLKFNYRKPSA